MQLMLVTKLDRCVILHTGTPCAPDVHNGSAVVIMIHTQATSAHTEQGEHKQPGTAMCTCMSITLERGWTITWIS